MSVDRFIIRHLAFTGPNIREARLNFDSGLNIVWGASNTGKSFTAEALSFMLAGTSKLPQIDEAKPYTDAWLGLTLPSGRNVTLHRLTRGGNFRLFDGLISSDAGEWTQLSGTAAAGKKDTVSYLLLDAINYSDKVIVKNANGEKNNINIGDILPYVIVSETRIMSKESPIHYSGQYTDKTFEANLLRFIMTGQDDSAALTVVGQKDQRVAKAAKLELVDELIVQIDEEISKTSTDRLEISDQIQRLSKTLSGLSGHLEAEQKRLDSLVAERRTLLDQQEEVTSRLTELSLTLDRFALLDKTYTNDLKRLQSTEEGGSILLARADRECPVCGAPPESQRHRHAPKEFELAHRAVAAEVQKIKWEQRDLGTTIQQVEAEKYNLNSVAASLSEALQNIESKIAIARSAENSARHNFTEMLEMRTRLEQVEQLYLRKEQLCARRSQINSKKATKNEAKISTGIDRTTAYELGKKVATVLDKWKFPQASQAQFDLETKDITIAGKARADNGKGVRTILHAAFNVALLLYCREKELPHPGFVVLDTPLLTYRPPLSRHGELSADETQMKSSPVVTNFYEHLASLPDIQVIILENVDAPTNLTGRAKIQVFTGHHDGNRFGLFEPIPEIQTH